jgi:hypothetical protein
LLLSGVGRAAGINRESWKSMIAEYAFTFLTASLSPSSMRYFAGTFRVLSGPPLRVSSGYAQEFFGTPAGSPTYSISPGNLP